MALQLRLGGALPPAAHVPAAAAAAAAALPRPASLQVGDPGCFCDGDSEDEAAVQASAVLVDGQPSPALTHALAATLAALASGPAAGVAATWRVVAVTSRAARFWLREHFALALASGRLQHWETAADGSRGLSRLCIVGDDVCVAARVEPAVLARDVGQPGGAGAWPADGSLAGEMATRPELYLALRTEALLFLAADGLLCTPANASALRSLAATVDYAGGVGFSLRSRAAMQRVVAEREASWDAAAAAHDGTGVDSWLSAAVASLGGRLLETTAADFRATAGHSVAGNGRAPIGFYRPWVRVPRVSDWAALAAACPAAEAAMAAGAPDCVACMYAGVLALAALLAARLVAGAWVLAVEHDNVGDELCSGGGARKPVSSAPGDGVPRGDRVLTIVPAVASWMRSAEASAARGFSMFASAASLPDAREPPPPPLWPPWAPRAAQVACAAAFASAVALYVLHAALLRCGHHHAWLVRRPGHLSTVCAPGRLGNRLFHTLAVSMLAHRYDLATEYEEHAEFARLGLPLAAGARRMADGPAVVLDEARWEALMAAPPGAVLHERLDIGALVYFQTPAFARHARALLQAPAVQRALLAANPGRARAHANDDVFVHVRLGDLDAAAFSHFTRPHADFIAAVANISARGRVFVASDEPDRAEVQAVAGAFGGEVLALDRIAAWQFGMLCKHLVLSDSTFSWAVAAMHVRQPGSTVRILPRLGEAWLAGDIFGGFDDWLVLRGELGQSTAAAQQTHVANHSLSPHK